MYKSSFSSHFSKFSAASLILALLLVVSPVLSVMADTAGANNAGTGTNVNGAGTINWATPGNITNTVDTNYATAVLTPNATSEDLRATNYGFSIPANAIINGIQVSIRRQSSANTGGNSIDDSVVRLLKAGVPVGNDEGTNTDWPIAFGVANYNGGVDPLWGTTWTPAQINAANFGVTLSAVNESGLGNRTASVDYIQITVTYTLAAEIDVQGNAVSITDGDATPSLTDHTDFGDVPRNFSVDRTFTIRNTDLTNNLLVGAITFTGGETGDFSVVTPPAATVAPGGSTTFTVRLTAGNGGVDDTRNTTINIAVNDIDENPFNFNVQGNRTTAGIDVQGNGVSIVDGDTTPSLNDHTHFGNISLISSVTRIYTIENTSGTQTLYLGTVTIGGTNAGDFAVTSVPASTVAPNGTTTFNVTFTPSATGIRNASINFINNDNNESPYNFNIQGTVLPEINILGNGVSIVDGDPTPSLADHTHFGNTAIGTPVTRTYTVENTGTQPLTLGAITIGGANAGDFTVITPPVSPVAPSGTTTFTVQFSSSAIGTRNASISLANNDVDENPYNFNIQGTSLPEMDVQGNSISIADGDGSPSTADGTDWGTVAVGTNVDHTFTIYNTGVANLTLSAPALTGSTISFTVLTPPTSPVPPGGSTTFVIRFSPIATGGPVKNATVSITNNDSNENPYTFDITGTRPIPEIDIQGNSISIADGDGSPSYADGTQWGYVGTGVSVDHTFTIRNTGAVNLNLSNWRLTGSTISFSILTPPAAIVSPGNSTTFVIRFSPNAAGGVTKDAVFLVDNDDPNENPYDFDLQGTRLDTGAEADVQGNGLSIVDGDTTPSTTDDTDFGNVNVGSSATSTFTIYNYGVSNLTVTNLVVTGNYSVTSAPTSPVVSGGSTTFDVQFTPSGLGVQTGTISFDNNDTGTENPYNFSLTGTGVDLTPPETTITSQPTDPSNATTPAFQFTGDDGIGSGVASFECQMDGVGGFVACVSGDTFGPLTVGSHTFEVRAIDVAGNVDASPATYTWTIDTTAPDTQIDTSPANPDNNLSPAFTFSSPDADVASFECQMDGVGGFVACVSGDVFGPLTAGSHTFEVRAIDTAGNVDASPASYTWLIDTAYPYVLFNLDTVPAQDALLKPAVLQIEIAFSKDVKSDGSITAANNTANYLLVEDGGNNTFDTVSCAPPGLVADDTPITVNSATYTNNGGAGPFVATLTVNNGFTMPSGVYRLFICGTTSVEDLAGNELNNGLSDAQLNFTVITLARLPLTGFPQGQVTTLPVQSAELAYASYSDLWLEIPKLNVKTSIVGVPSTTDGWNVNWLNKDAGWLNGSAFPTWAGNSVITAHVWDALNKPGPFAELKNLKYGDQVKVHAFGQVFTYEIRETKTVSPTSTYTVFKHEDKSWITLITCEDYKEGSQTYSHRRMVRAVLIKVASE